MVYQPICSLPSLAILGYEALSRFDEPLSDAIPAAVTDDDRRGFSPDVWFAQADCEGLRVDLELAAIERALTEALPILPHHQYISVNAAPVTFATRRLRRLLARHDRSRVMVELTEQIAVADHELLVGQVRRVRDSARIGTEVADPRRPRVRIAMDDVGAGYASMQLVQELAGAHVLDAAKLDRFFGRGIHLDPLRRAMAEHLVRLGRIAGFTTVAEGIETPAELATVTGLGVAAAQGYLDDDATGLRLGRPGPLPRQPEAIGA